jgi:hypothetical protein
MALVTDRSGFPKSGLTFGQGSRNHVRVLDVPKLARLRHLAMSASWSLMGGERTLSGPPNLVEIDPEETSAESRVAVAKPLPAPMIVIVSLYDAAS